MIALKPRNLSAQAAATLENAAGGKDLIFVVPSTMDRDAKYQECYLASTDSQLIVCEGEKIEFYPWSDFDKLKIRRMYGNAFLCLTKEGAEDNAIFRFGNDALSLCDAVSEYREDEEIRIH